MSDTKIQPQAIDIEEAILGAIMLDKMAFATANKIIKQSTFYLDNHMKIWQAAVMLDNLNKPIDLLTITNQLKENGQLSKDGINPYFITQLTNRVAGAANIEHHCMILLQKKKKGSI